MKKAMRVLRSLDREPRFGARRFVSCLFLLPFAVGTPAQQPGIAGIVDNVKPTFATFEAPGAGAAAGQGTTAVSIVSFRQRCVNSTSLAC